MSAKRKDTKLFHGGSMPCELSVLAGENIRKVRLSCKMTQAELGKAVGFTVRVNNVGAGHCPRITGYESFKGMLNLTTLERIAGALGVQPWELLTPNIEEYVDL